MIACVRASKIILCDTISFRCPCCCRRRPGGRSGPRRAALCRPPPCEAATGLYLVLLFSLSVHFLLYSSIMIVIVIVIVLCILLHIIYI